MHAPPRANRLGLPGRHPRAIVILFLTCGVFVVLPFFDLPFIGLSITAPLILPVFYYAFFTSSKSWLHQYRGWLWIGAGIWSAMLISFLANGPWFEGREMQYLEFAYLNRYLYWISVFMVSSWMASDFRVQRRLSGILAAAVVALAGVRGFEGFVFGKVGAWSGTIFTTQNTYGILFSTFCPFLFPALLSRRHIYKLLAAIGLLVVLYACAINGSRGSWICIALGLGVFLLLVLLSRPAVSLRVVLPLGFAIVALVAIMAGSASVREATFNRFDTFANLEKDKSYAIRQLMNQRNLKLFANYPLFGVGPGRIREVYVPLEMPAILAGRNDVDFMRKSSHNSYLGLLGEGGVFVALPVAVLLVLLAVRGGWAAASLNRQGEHWALGVYASFISMSVHLWVMSGLTTTSPWFVYGLLVATIVLAARAPAKSSVRVARPRVVRPRPAFAPHRPIPVGSP